MKLRAINHHATTLGNVLLYRVNKTDGVEFLGVGRFMKPRDGDGVWVTYDKWVLLPTHYIDPHDLPLPEATKD